MMKKKCGNATKETLADIIRKDQVSHIHTWNKRRGMYPKIVCERITKYFT